VKSRKLEKRSDERGADRKYQAAVPDRALCNFIFPAVEGSGYAVCVIDRIRRLNAHFAALHLADYLIRKYERILMPADTRNAARALVGNHAHKQSLQFGGVSPGRNEAKSVVEQFTKQIVAADKRGTWQRQLMPAPAIVADSDENAGRLAVCVLSCRQEFYR